LALAIVLAMIAVALGAALGLASGERRRSIGVLRWLALLLALAVVFGHLLPEAVHGIGFVGALAGFFLGLALPFALERVFRGRLSVMRDLGLELGFWGLLVHHVGDGLALGTVVRIDEHRGGGHADVLLALVAHTVPLVAVVAAAYAQSEGRRSAALRCGAFAVASVVGIFAASGFDAETVESFHTWISAGVSGLLLHVAVHDLRLPRVGRAD
jgi:hypothetical protein